MAKRTDKRRLMELLSAFGVPFREEDHETCQHIGIDADADGPVLGSNGFYANFVFEPDGKFRLIGIYDNG